MVKELNSNGGAIHFHKLEGRECQTVPFSGVIDP